MTESLGESPKLIDFIHLKKGFLSDEFCDEVVQTYESENFQYGGHHSFDVKTRNLKELNISDRNFINATDSYRRAKIDDAIHGILCENERLQALYLDSNFAVDSGYSLRRMEKHHYYNYHTDQGLGVDWKISCSIGLTDDYTGGELQFFRNPNISFKLGKGDLLTFPSNFMFPHEVLPVKSGVRYVIVTWLS